MSPDIDFILKLSKQILWRAAII